MPNAITIRTLVKTFGTTRALDGLDLEVRTGEVHGGLVVLQLAPHRQQLPRLAVARTEVPVVEQQHVHAGGRKAFGIRFERSVASGAEAVGHDDAGTGAAVTAIRGRVAPRSARRAPAAERDVRAWHGGLRA